MKRKYEVFAPEICWNSTAEMGLICKKKNKNKSLRHLRLKPCLLLTCVLLLIIKYKKFKTSTII